MNQITIPAENITIKITSKSFDVTPAIKSKVEQRITALDKFLRGNKQAKVNLSKEPEGEKVEILLYVGKRFLKVKATSVDLYEAIDIATKKMKHQLSKVSKSIERAQTRRSVRHTHYSYPVDQDNFGVHEETLPNLEELREIQFVEKPITFEEAANLLKWNNLSEVFYIDANSFEQTSLTRSEAREIKMQELITA